MKLSRRLKRQVRLEERGLEDLARRDRILNASTRRTSASSSTTSSTNARTKHVVFDDDDDDLLPGGAGCLEADPSVFGEKTLKVRQAEIRSAVDAGTLAKSFDLELPFGPYCTSYTPNGRHMVLAGMNGGHVSLLDTQSLQSLCELKLRESVRCVAALHNDNIFAVSQKRCAYMYDRNGVEIHKLKDHAMIHQMEYLRYHYLLCTGSEYGDMRFLDVTSGTVVSHLKTKKGPLHCMRQNKRTAVMHAGHTNGVVSLWTPNMKEPCLKMLAHKGAVQCLDMHGENFLVSSGADGKWKIFDMRRPAEPVLSQNYYNNPVLSIDVSQTGLLALGTAKKVEIYGSNVWNANPSLFTHYNATIEKMNSNSRSSMKISQSVDFSSEINARTSVLLPDNGVTVTRGKLTKSEKAQNRALAERGAQPILSKRGFSVEAYMRQDFHGSGSDVHQVRFQPFQDVLSVGTRKGLSQLLIPGAGTAQFDSQACNPYETKRQKREAEVHGLMEKLPWDMIVYNPQFFHAGAKSQVGSFKAGGGPGAKMKKQSDGDAKSGKVVSVESKQKANNKQGGDALGNDSDDDNDSDSEFRQTGIRMTRGKKKMRGKNKVGKRLKKKEVGKAAERNADPNLSLTARKRKEGPAKPLDRTADVEADGALARFKNKKRRMMELS
ncbi:unnamed protein product [Amoebophrya sp. A25]|nr:unnamed protein product [Amoebophrya sp. A25]|eukprot:GSA25T00023438001.1